MAKSMVDAVHDDRTYRRVEVITGLRRRRDWSDADKQRIVGETLDPKSNISAVARRNGVSRRLLSIWRKQAREVACEEEPGAMFAALRVEGGAPFRDDLVNPAPRTRAALTAATGTGAITTHIDGAKVRVPTVTCNCVAKACKR